MLFASREVDKPLQVLRDNARIDSDQHPQRPRRSSDESVDFWSFLSGRERLLKQRQLLSFRAPVFCYLRKGLTSIPRMSNCPQLLRLA